MSLDGIFGGSDEPVTTTREPWAPAHNALKGILGESSNLYSGGLDFLKGRFNQGNPLFDASANTLGSLISGDTLDVTNSPMWGSMKGGIQDAVNSQFSLAGRTGSPAHAGVMTSELGKLAANLWGQERGRQLQGISMAPGVYGFGNAGLDDIWQNLARYSQIAQGIGGMGGTETGEPEGPGGLQQALGTAISLASLFA